MASVGERLKNQREARDTTIEQLAAATGIHLGYLEALERNDFHSLPGRAFGKLYIRAYAQTLGFDPQSLIDDYEREHEQQRQASTRAPHQEPTRPRRVEAVIAAWRQATIAERAKSDELLPSLDEEPEEPEEAVESGSDVSDDDGTGGAPRTRRADGAEPGADPDREDVLPAVPSSAPGTRHTKAAFWSHRPLFVALLCSGLLIAAAGALFTFFRTDIENGEKVTPVTPEAEIPAQDPPPVESEVETRPTPRPELGVETPPAGAAAGEARRPVHLRVSEFGVGRRIVDHVLEGRSERFAASDVAFFSTRVLGGVDGEPIHHVWLHEGRVQQSIRLMLGGSDWRTHSRKTLRATGQWAVEARDEAGRALARATFTCEPSRSQGTNLR